MRRQYTAEFIRRELKRKMKGKTQTAFAREIGVHRQVLCLVLNGDQPTQRILAWLGYRRVEGLYERAK
jgi:hypothetical protein